MLQRGVWGKRSFVNVLEEERKEGRLDTTNMRRVRLVQTKRKGETNLTIFARDLFVPLVRTRMNNAAVQGQCLLVVLLV